MQKAFKYSKDEGRGLARYKKRSHIPVSVEPLHQPQRGNDEEYDGNPRLLHRLPNTPWTVYEHEGPPRIADGRFRISCVEQTTTRIACKVSWMDSGGH